MTISRTDVSAIASNIWSTQLGLELADSTSQSQGLIQSIQADSMTGSVQITGDWAGAVHLHAPRALVLKAAEVMFARPPADLCIEDIRDALGELTNMTAGNIKALLEGENHLSLPTVVEGTDYDITSIGSAEVVDVAFTLDGQPLVIVIMKGMG